MNITEVDISSLSPDPSNLRKHPPEQVERVAAILRRFGQTLPLLVDPSGTIRVGNCRFAAMRLLGWTRVKISVLDLPPSEWVALALADNKAPDGSTFDLDGLVATLTAMRAEGQDLASVGFSAEEYADLIQTDPANEQSAPDDFQSFDEDIPTDHECPKCKYRWSGSSAPAGAA